MSLHLRHFGRPSTTLCRRHDPYHGLAVPPSPQLATSLNRTTPRRARPTDGTHSTRIHKSHKTCLGFSKTSQISYIHFVQVFHPSLTVSSIQPRISYIHFVQVFHPSLTDSSVHLESHTSTLFKCSIHHLRSHPYTSNLIHPLGSSAPSITYGVIHTPRISYIPLVQVFHQSFTESSIQHGYIEVPRLLH